MTSAAMQTLFEELDYQHTPLGDISLRRRSDLRLDGLVLYEVKLDDDFLMSSLFTEAEEQLSRLGLAELVNNGHTSELDVIVGGLGLGYTAAAVLDDEAVKTLKVIDVMEPVINWHQRGLVPLGQVLTEDKRCSLIKGDFFALATDSEKGFIDTDPTALVHAVLLDIDHSPEHWLNADNASFYSTASLQSVSDKLYNGGVFGLWSNDPPDETFINTLESVFSQTKTHVVSFLNPYTNEMANNTVYISSK